MFSGGKKFVKTPKTKMRKNEDGSFKQPKDQQKQKHHDKSYYRMIREEKQYEL